MRERLLLFSCFLVFGTSTICAADRVDYSASVKPLLASRCYACHGASRQEGGLRLDTGKSVHAGGDSGPAVSPGRSSESLLLARLTSDDPDERMPLESEPLHAAEFALITQWIDQGAQFPDGEMPQPDPRKHWAYQLPQTSPVPIVANGGWVRTPIDSFLLARMEREGITPSPEAGRQTLIRRLYLDLLGLPPRPEEIEAFMSDDRPDAYERLVDQLLANAAFGERWGRHWLDLARYADSNGYEDDRLRPDAWRFRDWVIDAVNSDLAFDKFTIWQLAGDLLPDATYEQKVATGFHRMTLSNDGGADSVEEEFRIIAVKDRVDTTGSVWLGLSVGCAKCHAHKYDPISQREYYQLFAFFNNVADETVPAPPLPQRYTDEYQRKLEILNRRFEAIRASLADYETSVLPEKLAEWESSGKADAAVLSAMRGLLAVPAQRRTLKDQLKLTEMLKPVDPDYAGKRADMLVNAGNNRPLPPSSRALVLASKQRESRVHRRGSFLDLGEPVKPGIPEFLPPLGSRSDVADRFDLAQWIADEDNPLTSRVAVNHLWRLLLGRGLVATPDEFGVTGSPPSHPELLDWLAVEFTRLGWSRKSMIRLIVTSAVYRQESKVRPELIEKDPDNVLVARQARMRVEAECVRDLALATAGLLNREIGGPSFQPVLPAGLEQIDELKNEQFVETSEGPQRYRRGVYIHAQRMLMLPMLQAFDAADPNVTCARRDRSNTPLQALTLLNDPVFFEAARELGHRMIAEGPTDPAERIRWAFRICLTREADTEEQAALVALLDRLRNLGESSPLVAAALAADSLPRKDVDTVEVAAWIGLARTLLNLDEFITRE